MGPLSLMVFLLFLVVMSIILMNLLIGLTVSDIQALTYQAHATRISLLLDTLIEMDPLVIFCTNWKHCCFARHHDRRSVKNGDGKVPSAKVKPAHEDKMWLMNLELSPTAKAKLSGQWLQLVEECQAIVEDGEARRAEASANSTSTPSSSKRSDCHVCNNGFSEEFCKLKELLVEIQNVIGDLEQTVCSIRSSDQIDNSSER